MAGGLAFVAAYAMQRKGFYYHALPATGLFFAALGWSIERRTTIREVATVAVMLIPFAMIGTYRNSQEQLADRLFADLPPGSPVLLLSVTPVFAWPMVEEHDLVWASRHFSLFMFASFGPAIQGAGLDLEQQRVADEVRDQTTADIACAEPVAIFVDDLTWSTAAGLDLVGYFSRDAAFRSVFAHYRKDQKVDHFWIYRRDAASGPIPRPARCRSIF
jgi:hypothetical protein